MLTLFKEKTSTSSVMGNGSNGGEKNLNKEQEEDAILRKTLQMGGLNLGQSTDDLIFFAGTDKARV